MNGIAAMAITPAKAANRKRRFAVRRISAPKRSMQRKPVRVSVPNGMHKQANISAPAKIVTRLPGGKIVPYRASQTISGISATATIDRVLPS